MKNAHTNRNSPKQREKQRALALAALTQTSFLITSIAQEGKFERQYFEHCIDALLGDDYTNNQHFSLGNSQAKRLLQGHDLKYAKHIMRHTAAMLTVEKKLAKQTTTLQEIDSGMQRVQKQIQYFGSPHHENIIAALAHLYGETISTMKPRIIIHGKAEFLKQQCHTERVRCLLFSGIRAAWIWRTNGGNTLRLLLGRKKLIQQLQHLAEHH